MRSSRYLCGGSIINQNWLEKHFYFD
ncbi:hypothetical protein B4U80_06613 [Leptotrombidium deliense]|uniref:Uncharacterized protein n=1 Tax=Leptotrombidium deliense TaxID=299467 RepID=A0A443S1I2_9ACAR|nr:hypothetical protein B4U80_06613 [Leptotrombidium deliense]